MKADPYKYFRVEAREIVDQLGQGALDLEKGGPSEELVSRVLRLAHTLKGAARVVRQPSIAEHAERFLAGGVSPAAPRLAATVILMRSEPGFEVFGHRLASEFNAPAEILNAGYQAIRRTDPASVARLREIGGIRILNRSDGALVALFENRYRLARLEADEPDLLLEPLVAGAIPVC